MIHLLSPGDPDQRTGGYLYNRRVVDAWRARGRDVAVHAVDGVWPLPGGSGGLPTVAPGDRVLADGLLWTGLGPARRSLREARVTVLVHLALHEDSGLTALERDRRRALEAAALAEADAVVVTGEPTRLALEARSVLVPPGLDAREPSVGSPLALLTVATVTPRKAFDDLVRVLDGVDRPWTWTVAGSLDRDPEEARRLREAVAARGWSGRVRLLGELDDTGMREVYRSHGLLLHAAHHEPWGMALQEALGHGLPVVSRAAGALEAAPAGSYEVFDSVAEGRAALLAVLDAATAYGEAARTSRWPTWEETAEALWAVVER